MLFGIYTSLLLTIFLLAYLGLIPRGLKAIPFYDSLGHFVLYGTWGYLFGKVFSKILQIGSLKIPTGIFIVTIIAITEECLQSLSSVRTFSLFDLGWGILGIFFAYILLKLSKKGVHENRF